MLNLFNFPFLISKQKIKRKYWFVDIPIPESPQDKHKIPVINLYTLYTPPVLGLSIYTPPPLYVLGGVYGCRKTCQYNLSIDCMIPCTLLILQSMYSSNCSKRLYTPYMRCESYCLENVSLTLCIFWYSSRPIWYPREFKNVTFNCKVCQCTLNDTHQNRLIRTSVFSQNLEPDQLGVYEIGES